MENQNVEYKEAWRDEYLKWICGFANAQGGRLLVGVADDGRAVGVDEPKRLMEEIPNKVRDLMGILVQPNLVSVDGKDVVEIVTEDYPYPISYKGKYYQRSGATNQELKGASLDRFMLRRQGKTWDGVPVPYLKAEDLDNSAFELFRKLAKRSGRMEETDLLDDNAGLLDKLRLSEGDYLKRAVALLFHPDPERYVTGAFIKIGYFRKDADLVYQDEVHGYLFQQVQETLSVISRKYHKAVITYEGIQRIETPPVPREALRECLLNAVVHKAYDLTTPIQIAVYDDRMEVWNPAVLPDGWTVETLTQSHRSHPYNPSVANVFFRAGEIESWGRGIERVVKACEKAGTPLPQFHHDGTGLWTTFPYSEEYLRRLQSPRDTVNGTVNDTVNGTVNDTVNGTVNQNDGVNDGVNSLSELQAKVYDAIVKDATISYEQLSENLSLSRRTIARNVTELKRLGIIERVGSDKTGKWRILK